MNSILNWFLMILPFALWGTSMAAMTPLVSSAGPEFVASLRLLPAGILVLITTYLLKRDLRIYKCDLKWFFVFTIVDATLFQLFLTYGIEKTGAGLGSVLIDSQPLLVAILARAIFGNLIKIVPNAMAREAASIQSSPKLKVTSFIDLSDINHQFTKTSCGTPKNTIPPKPKSSPNHPIGLIKFPKIARAKIATKSG